MVLVSAKHDLSVDRQREREDTALAETACNTQRAAVRLDNSLRNWQSHSSSLKHVALVLSAIEFVENKVLFVSVNPNAPINHAGHHEISSHLDSDRDRFFGWRILACIFEQLRQSFLDQAQVRTRGRQPRRNLNLNQPSAEQGLAVSPCGI